MITIVKCLLLKIKYLTTLLYGYFTVTMNKLIFIWSWIARIIFLMFLMPSESYVRILNNKSHVI